MISNEPRKGGQLNVIAVDSHQNGQQIVSRELRPALENNLKKVIRSAEHQHRRSKRAQK